MLLTLSLLATLHAPIAQDSIAGPWRLMGEISGTPIDMVCTLALTASVISGNCLGEKGIPQPITGEVKDGKIIFQHGGDYQGQELMIIYTATLPKHGEMKGTILVKPFEAEGAFTAVPEPQKK